MLTEAAAVAGSNVQTHPTQSCILAAINIIISKLHSQIAWWVSDLFSNFTIYTHHTSNTCTVGDNQSAILSHVNMSSVTLDVITSLFYELRRLFKFFAKGSVFISLGTVQTKVLILCAYVGLVNFFGN